MSHSTEDRIANLEYALKLFVRDVGDTYYDAGFITPGGDVEYDQIFPTTWRELTDKFYLRQVFHGTFKITSYGWITGDPAFKQRLGLLSKINT